MKSLLLRHLLVLSALAVLPAIAQAIYYHDRVSWRTSTPASELVSVEQARSWGGTAIWADARPDEEFERDHVPGAISLNEDHWNVLLPQFLAAWSPEKKVVVYCSARSCNAARDVANRLRDEAQLKNVYVLEGGWEAWLKERREHPTPKAFASRQLNSDKSRAGVQH